MRYLATISSDSGPFYFGTDIEGSSQIVMNAMRRHPAVKFFVFDICLSDSSHFVDCDKRRIQKWFYY